MVNSGVVGHGHGLLNFINLFILFHCSCLSVLLIIIHWEMDTVRDIGTTRAIMVANNGKHSRMGRYLGVLHGLVEPSGCESE